MKLDRGYGREKRYLVARQMGQLRGSLMAVKGGGKVCDAVAPLTRLSRLFCTPDEIIPHGAQAVGCVDLLVFDLAFFVAGPGRVA